MGITLFYEDYEDLDDFVEHLVFYIGNIGNLYINDKKLIKCQQYFDSKKIDLDIVKIILIALNNLNINRTTRFVTIKIDEKKVIPNTSLRIIDICKMINYGNFELQAYPLFTNIFNFVKRYIDGIYVMYLEGQI